MFVATPGLPVRAERLWAALLAATAGGLAQLLVGYGIVFGTGGGWISPIARALMRAFEGDVVKMRTPAGEEEIEILRVEYVLTAGHSCGELPVVR